MRNKKLYLGLIGLVVAVIAVVAISVSVTNHSSRGQGQAAMPAAATHSVTIRNYMFSPAVIKVRVGTTVTWTNNDPVNHTVTADTASSDAPSSMDIAQGKSYSYRFNKPGTYTYHCFPHPYMHGTVEVTKS